MKSGDGGRSAQRWPPARFASCGAGFEACRPDLVASNQADQQALVQVEIEICEGRFAAAHLGHGDIVVPGMFLFARMLVIKRIRMVHMCVFSVAVEQLSVKMDTPRTADVAVGVHMHVQAAELNGQEAHTCNDRYRVSQTAHGENCITPFCRRQGHSQHPSSTLTPDGFLLYSSRSSRHAWRTKKGPLRALFRSIPKLGLETETHGGANLTATGFAHGSGASAIVELQKDPTKAGTEVEIVRLIIEVSTP